MTAMSQKSADYWAKRFDIVEQSANDLSVDYCRTIDKRYALAMRALDALIESWYIRLAKNNKISLKDARKFLTDAELEEFRWSLEEYIDYGRRNSVNPRWVKQLENASVKHHISKLEALKIMCQQELEKLFQPYASEMPSLFTKTYEQTYYLACYEIQKGLGAGVQISSIDTNMIKNFVAKPWAIDGEHFSDRVWKNKTKLINTLQQEIDKMVFTNGNIRDTIKAVQKATNVSKYQAQRVVLTENAFFATVGEKQSYKEIGIDVYEVVGTLDKRTCEHCGGMDKRRFKVSDMQIGVNAPPFHPNCRCTTCPYYEEDFMQNYVRASRDSEGKTIHVVPSHMDYNTWRGTMVKEDKE